MRHDGVLSSLGATAELAGDGASVSGQLGIGVSLGGVVCAVGLGPPRTAGSGVDGRGRDSLGPRLAGRQLPDRDLPDRRAVPTPAVGGETALGSDAAARAEGAGAGGGRRVALYLQRYVEALPERHRGRSRASAARVGSLSYHYPFESGGGSGAPSGELASAGSGQGDGAAAQAYALAVVAPGQSGTRASPAKAGGAVGEQAGHRPGLGVEGNLLP